MYQIATRIVPHSRRRVPMCPSKRKVSRLSECVSGATTDDAAAGCGGAGEGATGGSAGEAGVCAPSGWAVGFGFC